MVIYIEEVVHYVVVDGGRKCDVINHVVKCETNGEGKESNVQ